MAMWRYGLVFSLALIVTAADKCRDRHEAIDFPLKYVTVPDDKPIDWEEAHQQCRIQHPGYDILARRYLWLSEKQKAPCKDLLVPFGLKKYEYIDDEIVHWHVLPPIQDRIRSADLAKYRQVKEVTGNEYYGALNLNDGTWQWVLDDPIFTCVICQKYENYTRINDALNIVPCFYTDSWIDKTIYQITLQHVAGGDFQDDYKIEEAVACAFNLTHNLVAIMEDDDEEYRNEVIVHLALNGRVDAQRYLGKKLAGYKLTELLVVDKLKMCPENTFARKLRRNFGANKIYQTAKYYLDCISTFVPRMVEYIFL